MERNSTGSPGSGVVGCVCAVAIAWRAVISWRTPLPSEDGANYLWMAERFAVGSAADAASEVFPPLFSMLIAVPVWLGLEPLVAAQVVQALVGGATVVVVARTAERLAPGTGLAAAGLTALAPLLVRFGAEAYTEPLFVLLAAGSIHLALVGRLAAAGLVAGIAFWVRPEAAILVVGLVVAQPARSWRSLPTFAVGAIGLAAWRWSLGSGFSFSAKFGFNWERTVFATGEGGEVLARIASHAVEIPWLWVEAFGVLGLLAGWGFVRGRGRGAAPTGWVLALGVLVIVCFLPRRRFLLSWFAAVVPWAMLGWSALPSRVRQPVLGLALISSALLGWRTMDPNRVAERQVGEHLGARLAPGEDLVTGMTRVRYYAGLRPLPPRPVEALELIEQARRPEVRFVVLGSRRAHAPVVEAALQARFAPVALPDAMAGAAADRGITVLERR